MGELVDEMCSEMSGRLFTRIREERSLAYFVGSSRVSGLDTGMFYFYAGTQPGRVGEVFDEFSCEVERFRHADITAGEMKR